MKSRLKFKIVPRWEPEYRFAPVMRRHAPTARRAEEFFPASFFRFEEETWRISAPLQ